MHQHLTLHRGFGMLLITLLGLSAGSVLAQQRPGTTTRGGTGATRPSTGSVGGSGRTTSEYPKSTEIGTAMISTDPEARKLIIVTDDETFEHMRGVVENLDKPKPQVLINVVFVEVTHNDDLDLGVQGTYSRNAGSPHSGGTDFGASVVQQALNGGGGFYQYMNNDIDVTLTALAKVGKTEILSRPTILARNNQQATITIGQEVPLITGTRFDPVNGTINTITYQDVGIILRVTPFISSDGLVEMIISPEISQLSDRTVQISTNSAVPIIDKRSADTVTVTPSGQTIMIGGLLAKGKTETVQKVPLLGDLPWLGFAFRRTIRKVVKTELIILMTPNVIKEPGDLARATMSERARTELIPRVYGPQDLKTYVNDPLNQTNQPALKPDRSTPPAPKKGK